MTEQIVDLEQWKRDSQRPIWLLDRRTAMYIIHMATEVESGHRWYFNECPNCGGQYIEKLGHCCEDTLEIKCNLPDELHFDELAQKRMQLLEEE